MAKTKTRLSNSAGKPTINVKADNLKAENVKAERVAPSLAEERAMLLRRRALLIGLPGLIFLLLAGALLYSYAGRPASTAAPAQTAPTTVPPSAALGSGGLACPQVAGLPIFANAICVKHDTDEDDGITKSEVTYASGASADEVRRFYEGAFAQNGWTVAKAERDLEDNTWSYALTQAQRRLKIEIEPDRDASGAATKITIAEK